MSILIGLQPKTKAGYAIVINHDSCGYFGLTMRNVQCLDPIKYLKLGMFQRILGSPNSLHIVYKVNECN